MDSPLFRMHYALDTARIIAGAYFEKYANAGDIDKAITFQLLRDNIASFQQIVKFLGDRVE